MTSLFAIIGIFLVAVFILAMVTNRYRRRWLGEQDSEPMQTASFSISDLKRLYKEGELTEEEFEKAKSQIIALHTPKDDEQ